MALNGSLLAFELIIGWSFKGRGPVANASRKSRTRAAVAVAPSSKGNLSRVPACLIRCLNGSCSGEGEARRRATKQCRGGRWPSQHGGSDTAKGVNKFGQLRNNTEQCYCACIDCEFFYSQTCL